MGRHTAAMRHPRRLAVLPIVALAATGCVSVSPAATPTAMPAASASAIGSLPPSTTPSARPATTDPAATEPAATEPAAATPVAQVERAAWQTVPMKDVRTGETFTLADFAGKVVAVEPMAAWCINCLHQQQAVITALAALDSEDIVYISLDVDPTELPEDLAAYAEHWGFDWRFVLADRDLLRQLAGAFGDQVLAPPSTPKLLIGRDGTVTGPVFGHLDAAAIEAELRAALG